MQTINYRHVRRIILPALVVLTLLFGGLGLPTDVRADSLITVNTDADNTTAGDAFCTLREAINNANADADSTGGDCAAGSGADTISFAGDYTITLAGSQLPGVTTEMTINGNGAANTIIQAAATPNSATHRVMSVAHGGYLTLDGVTIQNGVFPVFSSTEGGGGILNQGRLTVNESIIRDNYARNEIGGGGGISNQPQGGFNAGTVIVTNSTFIGNRAFAGGAIYSRDDGNVTVINSTFSDNYASDDGGGAIAADSYTTVTLLNSTLSGNSSGGEGGGLYLFRSTLNYANNIIANNTGGRECYQEFSSIGLNLNNLIEGSNNCAPALTGDPMLGALADNGGPTPTFALLLGSPAINAGDAATCADPGTVNNLDQRGVTRPQGLGCDIGAFELELNTAPTADPGGPYLGAVNTAISFDGSASSDPDSDSLTYAWDFGDTATGTGAMPTHSYSETGIYNVCLTVNDGDLSSASACTIAVVYDPSAGFVTGGGWITSPEGAYTADPSLTGKATFGFVSKYKKGASVPDGTTSFAFDLAGLSFYSDSYEWLVVNGGGSNAQFKGSGTVNDGLDPNGNPYKFMLWAGDDSPDTFHIKIWWEDTDGSEYVVYDNGTDQPIGAGNIVVHKGK